MVSFAKFHRNGLGAPPSRFMRALCLHYAVELQHFSPNAITVAAVFAAVCEGYLGMMPHWDLWLHLYRGELFQRPHRNHWREEARAGRVPQPGVEDEEDGEATQVYPGGAVVC